MHQAKEIINTMSFASLNFRVVNTDAYKARMETLASVMPHMKRSSAMYSSCGLTLFTYFGGRVGVKPCISW